MLPHGFFRRRVGTPMPHFNFCLIVLALLLFAAGPVRAQRFGYAGIASVGTFNGESRAWDINNAGQVVGDSVNSDGNTRAFLWTSPGPPRQLPPFGSHRGSFARSINTGGVVAGGTGSATAPADAVTWSPPAYSPAVRVPLSTTLAYDVNDNGQVVGRNGGNDNDPPGTGGDGFRYTPGSGTIRLLGPPTGYTGSTRVFAINNAGYAVGWIRTVSPNKYRAALWPPTYPATDPQDLGTLGGDQSTAYHINNNNAGLIVGWANAPNNSRHAFVFEDANRNGVRDNAGRPDDEMHDLGTLSGLTNSEAHHISDSGYIVGDCYGEGAAARRPFVWTFTGGMQDLNDLLPAGSGWVLESARSINDNGVVVGWGLLNNQRRGYVLTLTPGPVPLKRADNVPWYFVTPFVLEYGDLIDEYGWFDLGPVGNIYAGANDVPGLTPLFRLLSLASGDHFYTISAAERDAIISNGSYVYEGIGGYVFPNEETGRKPLYRAYNPQTGQHRLIGNPDEWTALTAPWVQEGIAAWILPGDPVPLLRGDRNGADFYLTTSRAEGKGASRFGFVVRGAVGNVYVNANDAPGLVPFYRLYNPDNRDHFYTTSAAERDDIQRLTAPYLYEGIQCYVFTAPGTGRKPLYRAVNRNTGQHIFIGDPAEYNNLPDPPWQKEGIAAYIVP